MTGTESPERAAQWDNAKIGETVELCSVDFDPPCDAVQGDGPDAMLCTRDRGHRGQHVATGASIVLARWDA
jgi:hypothetical protein